MADIHGTCADRFGKVHDTLADLLDDVDVGASVAIDVDGEPVVDLWGGHTDPARTSPWQRDTIVNVWSITKTMTALCALVLADRGELDMDAPVARYWPEFAAAGKEGVLIRHVLSHTSGLPEWDEPMTVEDLYDWPAATARLAAQPPRWRPGTAAGYHAVSQGYLIGEVIRRITGRGVGAFFAEEIAGPLGADFHIVVPAEHHHKIAPIIPPPGDPVAPGPGSAGNPPRNPPLEPSDANTEAWRRAEIPAAGGHGNARSVCAVQSVLACRGTARGVRLLSEATSVRVLEEQYRGMDDVLGVRVRWGLGYALNGREMPISSSERVAFWGGWGGSLVMVDFDTRMTVAYVMNKMFDGGTTGDIRGLSIVMAAYDGLRGAA